MSDAPTADGGPGFLAFLAFFLLALALWFLMRNMNSRMRRMSYRQQAAHRGKDEPQATPEDLVAEHDGPPPGATRVDEADGSSPDRTRLRVRPTATRAPRPATRLTGAPRRVDDGAGRGVAAPGAEDHWPPLSRDGAGCGCLRGCRGDHWPPAGGVGVAQAIAGPVRASEAATKCAVNARMVSAWKTSWNPNQRGEKFGRLVP